MLSKWAWIKRTETEQQQSMVSSYHTWKRGFPRRPPTQQVHKKLQCPPLKIRCSCSQLQLVVLCAVARCCCCWQGKDVSVVPAWNSSLSSSQTSPPAFDWLSHSLSVSLPLPTHSCPINESKVNVLSDWLIIVVCWAKPDRPISSHYYEVYDDLNQHVMHTNAYTFWCMHIC